MKTKVGLQGPVKRRKKPWRVYWFGTPDENGKQRQFIKWFKHNREAKTFQIEKQAELNRYGPRDHLEAVTLGQLLGDFTATRLANVSHATFTEYTSHIRQLREFFGEDRSLRDIRRQDAERFIASRKRTKGVKPGETGPKLASWTLRGFVKTAGAIFTAGMEWGYIESNPFRVTGKCNSPLRIRTTSRPWHHLTPDEFSRFIEQVPTAQKRAAFWLMYACGLRPGEVYNLTADKVDLGRRRVRIENRAASDDLPPFTVKSETQTDADKSRVVPIPDEAVADITEAVADSFRAGGFVTLTPERFAVVQRNWRLCREGKPWGGRDNCRPWQNADMMHNLLRSARV